MKKILILANLLLQITLWSQSNNYELKTLRDSKLTWAVQRNEKGEVLEEGHILEGKKQGMWLVYFPGEWHIKSAGNYVDNKLTGIFKEFNNNGDIILEATFMNDVLDGPMTRWKRHKIKESNNYKNGKPDGVQKHYFDDGALQEMIEYTDGAYDGKFIYYDGQGNATLEYTYKNGKKLSQKVYSKQNTVSKPN
jgi:uncharacterized protein